MFCLNNGHALHYWNDGTGRDTYVETDNGGITENKYIGPNKVKLSPGAMWTKGVYDPPMPVMHAKPIYYRPDGSGRDVYIE